jgi:citrate synthase
MTNIDKGERSRADVFATNTPTSICYEAPHPANPYLAEDRFISGYKVSELAEHCSFTDLIYLQLTGEIPSQDMSKILQQLMNWVTNLGPRHEASRAAMNAGIGRTDLNHAIPISLCVLSGKTNGSQCVMESIKFIQGKTEEDPRVCVQELIKNMPVQIEPHMQLSPGFGLCYGSIDVFSQKMLQHFCKQCPDSTILTWVNEFSKELNTHGLGVLLTGVFACVCLELKLNAKQGLVLFQLAVAPSLAAYAIEKLGRPLTDMPFIAEENYEIL